MAKTEVSFTGSFSVAVSEDKLEAKLSFSREGPDATSWTVQEIGKFLQTNQVSAFKPEELNRVLTPPFQKAEKNFEIVVVKGSPPTPPSPEQIQLEKLAVPDEWKSAVELTLKDAAPPLVVKESQVKVEREKTVTKKATLPFLPAKEEKVRVVEKETVAEELIIDPTISEVAYVGEAGKRVALVYAAKVGKPGTTVDGKPIPAPIIEDPSFYPGQNVTRKGSEFTSQSAGIVRVGKNWIDIVAFEKHDWELNLSDDKVSCFLNFKPGNKHLPAPSYQNIVDEAVRLGIKAEFFHSAAEVDQWLREAIEKGTPIEKKSLSLAEDAYFEIVVSEDKLSAVLNLNKGAGNGKALVLKEIGQAINQSKLNMNREKVKNDILAFYRSAERSLMGYFLAEGTVPPEPQPQIANWDLTALSGKALDETKAKILSAVTANPDMASFPVDGIKQIAKVNKGDIFLALTPIVTGPAGKDVFGGVIPGVQSKELVFQFYGAVEKSGSLNFVAQETGVVLHAEKDEKLYFAALPFADGEIEVDVSPDDMKAFLFVRPHSGTGTPVKKEGILAQLEKAGVKKGVDDQVLTAVVASVEKGESVEHVLVANGQAPVPGGASEIKWYIEFASGQNLRTRADGSVDFRNQDHVTTVTKDTLLAEIMPPDHAPVAGWNVKGAVLNAPAAAGPPLEPGANIRQQKDENGKISLFAAVQGEVKRESGKLFIDEAYTIKGNVDSESGNIKFPGTVQVTGDVLSGFVVISGGEIKVAGSVEASLLTAESNIIIGGGVKGAGKALLRSKAGIQANFIEFGTILAIGEVRIKKALIRCRLKGNARLSMADDGQIFGGELRLKQGMTAGNIGNDKGVPTKIFFGQDVLVEDLIAVEEREIKKLQDELAVIDTTMKKSEKVSDRPALQVLFNRKLLFMKTLEKRNLRLFTLKERFEQHFESDIVVKGTLWPGVVIESHGRTHEVSKPTKGVRIYFDTASGRIVETQIGQK